MSRLSFHLVLCLASAGAAQQPPADSPAGWTVREKTELAATCIVRGKVRVTDAQALERAVQRGGAYVRIDVIVKETLKGDADGRVHVMFFAAPPDHPHRYVPDADDLRAHDGQDRIVLLQHVGNRIFLADRFNGFAILEDDPQVLARVKRTIARHAAMAQMVPDADVAHAEDVSRVLDAIAEDPEEEQFGFIALQELGVAAVPAIVRHLDDARPIHADSIALTTDETKGGGPFRTLRARSFREALLAVLQNLTGQFLAFDPTECDEKRIATLVSHWRIYAQYVLEDSSASNRTAQHTDR